MIQTENLKLTNRHGLNVAIRVDAPQEPRGLAFIAHGQAGFMDQKHIEAFAQAFLANDYRVVRFDATHALGDSDGDMIDVTYKSYIEDLTDVINWARAQDWFMEPFALCGHSMGAQSTAWYAEQHPAEVSCLAAMAPVINYELHLKTLGPERAREWQDRGYIEIHSRSKPGVTGKVGWGVEESLKEFDLLPQAGRLTIPVLDVVGEFDRSCPVAHQQLFIQAIPGNTKQLVIIEEVDHNYRRPGAAVYDEKLDEVKTTLANWLKNI